MTKEEVAKYVNAITNGTISCGDRTTAYNVFRSLRTAVLDRHIPVTKAIGCSISAFKGDVADYSNSVPIEGHVNIGESFPELMVTLSDKIFLVNSDVKVSYIPITKGVNTMNTTYVVNEMTGLLVPTLHTNDYVCRGLKGDCKLYVYLATDTGYSDMAKNHSLIYQVNQDNKYGPAFPFNTDFCISDYVRILPLLPGTSDITVKFYNGMNQSHFLSLFNEWVKIKTDRFNEERN